MCLWLQQGALTAALYSPPHCFQDISFAVAAFIGIGITHAMECAHAAKGMPFAAALHVCVRFVGITQL